MKALLHVLKFLALGLLAMAVMVLLQIICIGEDR